MLQWPHASLHAQGTLALRVVAPYLLTASEPLPISDSVVGWLLDSLTDKNAADLCVRGCEWHV